MKSASVLISVSKALRSFIFAVMALITPYYLGSLGLSALSTGIIIFISVVSGSTLILLFPYVPLSTKNRIFLLSALLIGGLAILTIYRSIIFFIVALLLGGISLTGRDYSAFQPIEQFTIAHEEQEQQSRNVAFSIYNFGSYGSAAVAYVILFLIEKLTFYDVFSVLLTLSVIHLAVFVIIRFPGYSRPKHSKNFPEEIRKHVLTLSGLFAIDSFGGGFVSVSMLALWFKVVYSVSLYEAGLIFTIVNVVTGISVLISSRISNSIGLIKTMVFTHLISNVFLILMPIIPNLYAAQLFLYLRQTTSQIDVPARDSFTNTIIPADYRVHTNSVFSTVRMVGQIPGPAIGGYLVGTAPSSLLFAAGGIKIAYDLFLYLKYRWFKT
ncbi:MAG TPA: MFS transporter [Thermoplasmataceae archaeon]|nr:MFS transporter [Thermoplasmatales archaeon AK]HLH85414.1 MFS transporter [Thermoplasmataceae archaeon]